MHKQWLTAVLTAIILTLSSPSAVAGEVGVSVEFSDKEVSVIRAYYAENSGGSSKNGNGKNGNGKNGKPGKSLPPGIAKNLQRGKALPPGIAKQALPNGLVDLLPPAPRGYERIELDGKVLLVDIATQVIHDVLEDVILR